MFSEKVQDLINLHNKNNSIIFYSKSSQFLVTNYIKENFIRYLDNYEKIYVVDKSKTFEDLGLKNYLSVEEFLDDESVLSSIFKNLLSSEEKVILINDLETPKFLEACQELIKNNKLILISSKNKNEILTNFNADIHNLYLVEIDVKDGLLNVGEIEQFSKIKVDLVKDLENIHFEKKQVVKNVETKETIKVMEKNEMIEIKNDNVIYPISISVELENKMFTESFEKNLPLISFGNYDEKKYKFDRNDIPNELIHLFSIFGSECLLEKSKLKQFLVCIELQKKLIK